MPIFISTKTVVERLIPLVECPLGKLIHSEISYRADEILYNSTSQIIVRITWRNHGEG